MATIITIKDVAAFSKAVLAASKGFSAGETLRAAVKDAMVKAGLAKVGITVQQQYALKEYLFSLCPASNDPDEVKRRGKAITNALSRAHKDCGNTVLNSEGKPNARGVKNKKPEGGKPEGGKPEGGKPEGGKPEGGKPEGGKPEGGKPEGAAKEALAAFALVNEQAQVFFGLGEAKAQEHFLKTLALIQTATMAKITPPAPARKK